MAFMLLWPFLGLSQQAEKVGDEFASKSVSRQAKLVAFSIEKKTVVSDLPANLRFSFTRIKGVFTLPGSNFHFIEKTREFFI